MSRDGSSLDIKNFVMYMGLFNFIKSAFNWLFGDVEIAKYDDTEIINAVNNYPETLGENICTQIKNIANDIHKVYNAANSKEFTIGIIGDFTVGKSSFVNAILGARVTPVSANPSTAIITKIKYGKEPKAVILYSDKREVEMTYEKFIEFSAFNLDDFKEREQTGDIKRFNEIEYATIYVKSDFLKANNLCLVDTLGLSAHESDNKKTIASIKDSIATIYICEERGLSDKDVDFISTYLSPERGDFFFCINRIDLVKKDERESVSQLVKLKLDEILHKSGTVGDFPCGRIYQVSSLYQEFANGFTDHDDWREDIDYQSRSGFEPIMNDLCNYVKNNADASRSQAITKQLQAAKTQFDSLLEYRMDEMNSLITANESKIKYYIAEIRRINNQIAYINSLFENLEQTIYRYFPSQYNTYSSNVNEGWNGVLNSLVSQVSFGFGDYMALERDILALRLNVLNSMKDSRYAQLVSLSPIVKLTLLYLQDSLQPVINNCGNQIQNEIDTFAIRYSMQDVIKRQISFLYDIVYYARFPNIDITNAMYRAAAQAAVESTWVKNSTRKLRMLNAAKDEALKAMEKPFKDEMDMAFRKIQQFIKNCNSDAIINDVKRVNILAGQKQQLENINSSLKLQCERERSYFELVKESLQLSLNNK